jgi:hypothetical protein
MLRVHLHVEPHRCANTTQTVSVPHLVRRYPYLHTLPSPRAVVPVELGHVEPQLAELQVGLEPQPLILRVLQRLQRRLVEILGKPLPNRAVLRCNMVRCVTQSVVRCNVSNCVAPCQYDLRRIVLQHVVAGCSLLAPCCRVARCCHAGYCSLRRVRSGEMRQNTEYAAQAR